MVLWKILPFGTEMEAHLSKDFTLIKIDLPGHGKSKVYQRNSHRRIDGRKSKKSN